MITSTLALSSVIWALALSITRVGAHVHGGANGHNITMTPYVHFTPGDALWFEEWVPITHGAIFGACFGLFQLALVERLLSAMRNVMEAWWKQK